MWSCASLCLEQFYLCLLSRSVAYTLLFILKRVVVLYDELYGYLLFIPRLRKWIMELGLKLKVFHSKELYIFSNNFLVALILEKMWIFVIQLCFIKGFIRHIFYFLPTFVVYPSLLQKVLISSLPSKKYLFLVNLKSFNYWLSGSSKFTVLW